MTILYTAIIILGLANLITMLIIIKIRRKMKQNETSFVDELNRHYRHIHDLANQDRELKVEINRLNEKVNRLEFGD